jgi:hypothetical protein
MGNPVEVGNGPAAVTGDEIFNLKQTPLPTGGKVEESRMTRKSEDLPV